MRFHPFFNRPGFAKRGILVFTFIAILLGIHGCWSNRHASADIPTLVPIEFVAVLSKPEPIFLPREDRQQYLIKVLLDRDTLERLVYLSMAGSTDINHDRCYYIGQKKSFVFDSSGMVELIDGHRIPYFSYSRYYKALPFWEYFDDDQVFVHQPRPTKQADSLFGMLVHSFISSRNFIDLKDTSDNVNVFGKNTSRDTFLMHPFFGTMHSSIDGALIDSMYFTKGKMLDLQAYLEKLRE